LLISSRFGVMSTNSTLSFEYHYLSLKSLQETCSGHDSTGQTVFLLEDGSERIFPRRSLFSGNAQTWTKPSLDQSRALLLLCRHYKDLWQTLGFSESLVPSFYRDGITHFYIWRLLCETLSIPLEPLSLSPHSNYSFGKDPVPRRGITPSQGGSS